MNKKYLIIAFIIIHTLVSSLNAQIIIRGKETIPVVDNTVYLYLEEYIGDIQWEESKDSISWTSIEGQTSDSLQINPYEEKFYRAKVTKNNCEPFYSEYSQNIPKYETVAVSLPPNSALRNSNIYLSNVTDSIPVRSGESGEFVQYRKDGKAETMYWLTGDHGEIYMLGYFFSANNGAANEVNVFSTALTLLLMNPANGYISSNQKEHIINNVGALPEFTNLLNEVERLVMEGKDIFNAANTKLLELINSVPLEILLLDEENRTAKFSKSDEPISGGLPDGLILTNQDDKVLVENERTICYALAVYDNWNKKKLVGVYPLYGDEVIETWIGRGLGYTNKYIVDDLENSEYEFIFTDGIVSPYTDPIETAQILNIKASAIIIIESLIPSSLNLFIPQGCGNTLSNIAYDLFKEWSVGDFDYKYKSNSVYDAAEVVIDCMADLENFKYRELTSRALRALDFFKYGEPINYVVSWAANEHIGSSCKLVDWTNTVVNCFMVEAEKKNIQAVTCEKLAINAFLKEDKFYYEGTVVSGRAAFFSYNFDAETNLIESNEDGLLSDTIIVPDIPGTYKASIKVMWLGYDEVIAEDSVIIEVLEAQEVTLAVAGNNQEGLPDEALKNPLLIWPKDLKLTPPGIYYGNKLTYEWEVTRGGGYLIDMGETPMEFDKRWVLGPNADSTQHEVKVRIYNPACLNQIDTTYTFKATTQSDLKRFLIENSPWKDIEDYNNNEDHLLYFYENSVRNIYNDTDNDQYDDSWDFTRAWEIEGDTIWFINWPNYPNDSDATLTNVRIDGNKVMMDAECKYNAHRYREGECEEVHWIIVSVKE